MRRKTFTGKDYSGVLESTRNYYRDYSAEYVKFYENWAKGEGQFSGSEYMEGYEKVAKVLTSTAKPGESIIDIGCGVGKWSTLLAQAGAQVTSTDYLLSMLQQFSRTYKQHPFRSRISLVMSDGFRLPFKSEVFDAATLNWVLSHIPVPRNEQFLNEVGRVVRNGGWLFISDSYWRGQEGGKEQIHIREVDGKEYEVYKYYYEPSELEMLLKKTFGDVESLQPLHYELVCIAKKRWASNRLSLRLVQ